MEKEILIKFSNYLSTKDIVPNTLRSIGYGVLKFLYYIANSIFTIFKEILGVNTFYKSTEINKLYTEFKPLLVALFSLSIAYLGFLLITNKKQDRSNIMMNIILSIMLIVMLPSIMIKLGDITTESISALNSMEKSNNDESPVDIAYKDLFVDVQKLNDENFKKLPGKNEHNLSVPELNNLSINSVVENPSEPLKFKLNGSKLEEMKENGWLTIFENGYYRWHINFANGYVYMLTMIAVYGLSAIKLARIIFELAVNKIVGLLVVSTDLHSGQKTKAVFKEILKSYLTVIAMYLMLILYAYFTLFLNGLKLSPLANMALLIGSGFAVIDGAKIFERVIGIDSGLEDSHKSLMSLYYGGRIVKEGAQAAGNLAGNVIFGSEKARIERSEGNEAKNKGLYGLAKGEYKDGTNDNLTNEDNMEDITDSSTNIDDNLDTNLETSNADLTNNSDEVDSDLNNTNVSDNLESSINDIDTPNITDNLNTDISNMDMDNSNVTDNLNTGLNDNPSITDNLEMATQDNLSLDSRNKDNLNVAQEKVGEYFNSLSDNKNYDFKNSEVDKNILKNTYSYKGNSDIKGKEISIDLNTGVGREYNMTQKNKKSKLDKELINEFNMNEKGVGRDA